MTTAGQEGAMAAIRAVVGGRVMGGRFEGVQALKSLHTLQPIQPAPPPIFDELDTPPKIKSLSKKGDIAGLPKDWRARVFKAAKPEKLSRLASSVAVMWSIGCRPSEIENGVKITLINNQLVLMVRGAKHGMIKNHQGEFQRGIEWRKITINADLNDATKYLKRLAFDGKEHVIDYDKNSLRQRVNELGKVALVKLKTPPSISPYTFRHAMGSDLKSCDDLDDTTKAQIMGHLSCASLQVYGRRRHGGKGVSPVAKVETSAMPHGELSHEPPKKSAPRLKI
jgi:integrase